MSIIKLPLHYEGSQGEKILDTLFDIGASYSCINADDVKNLAERTRLRNPKWVKTTQDGDNLEAKYAVCLDFYIGEVSLSDEFMVVLNLSEAVILGDLTMRKWHIKLDFENNKAVVNPKVGKWQLIEIKGERASNV